MLENNWDALLAAAAGEVLETMFFTGIYGPGAAAPESEPRLAAHLTFEGARSGALTLSVSQTSADALASNFLALESEATPAQAGGVVCELANMICGALLSRLEIQTHFRITTPELLPAGAALPAGRFQSLDLGDGTLDLWLALEDHAG